eukprot:scaffold47691_cov39-Tisochrysis_lutea.AAC.3
MTHVDAQQGEVKLTHIMKLLISTRAFPDLHVPTRSLSIPSACEHAVIHSVPYPDHKREAPRINPCIPLSSCAHSLALYTKCLRTRGVTFGALRKIRTSIWWKVTTGNGHGFANHPQVPI